MGFHTMPETTFLAVATARVASSEGVVILEHINSGTQFTYTRKEARTMAAIVAPWAPELATALEQAADFAIQTVPKGE